MPLTMTHERCILRYELFGKDNKCSWAYRDRRCTLHTGTATTLRQAKAQVELRTGEQVNLSIRVA